ncbi:hypothetical protein N8T08_008247 [Aspergillus melleus]|uniref:Uncharacterized protein n=1 Tax=Aspergillus melleus TaxID=138277 RepID=A0ACC3AW27_9EURO|nr:hypothetical protein N8T08_008247 [Aspergillus melleus]
MGEPTTVSVCREPTCSSAESGYTASVLASCQRLGALKATEGFMLDGSSLDLSSVYAVARHDVPATITGNQRVLDQMTRSVDILNQKLSAGEIIYGVNTGFGGSADTRTNDYPALQKALIQHHNAAVVLPSDRGGAPIPGLKSHSMPVPVVKAAMLTRCNSLLRGHSAVRPEVVQHILALLANGMTPVVPLRGSISASGDLTPLAYIAGALEGNPDIGIYKDTTGEVVPSNQALQELGLSPLEFGPKEGLGLLNGTAFSAGAASLVLFEANQLVLLSQVLTAMGTEALLGTRFNYHPFIAEARPHEGQREAAANIFGFLTDSKLATTAHPGDEGGNEGLAQDRYALRTSSQWIGPQIENMALSLRQIEVELNSTTDNPLLDPVEQRIHHGGNFQAAAVTSAMEKTSGAMQMLGKMFFAQCSEIINPMLSNGLPPNLAFDDPSLSFAFKGVDINMASYISELGYLNHPVSNHVQSAEMHNQALNSLAFIAARYASDSVDILSLMAATYLYVLCQALDLRALHIEFVKAARPQIDAISASVGATDPATHSQVWEQLMHHWGRNSTYDLSDRARIAATYTLGSLVHLISSSGATLQPNAVPDWQSQVSDILSTSYASAREQFLASPTTKSYLCKASAKFYSFVRETLNVPLHRGIVDHPTFETGEADKKTIGSRIGEVYAALRRGEVRDVLVDCF